MFGRKKKNKVQVSISNADKVLSVSLPVLIRQVIYDTMLMPTEDIANSMGLPPISDEVADMEEQASEKRLQRFSRLLPLIDSHADIAAKIAVAAYLLEDDEIEEKLVEDTETLQRLFRLVALSSSLSCVSTLFNLELIELNGANNGKQ
jgi:hypothetical protein